MKPSDNEPISERRKQFITEDYYPWETKTEKHLDILLINPPSAEVYGSFKAAAKVGASPQMPLGILYIAGVLEKAGHKVSVIDCDIDGFTIDTIIEEIKKRKPHMIGFTAATPVFEITKEIIKRIKKETSIITMLGGFHITALPVQSMEQCPADFGFYGEAECTVVDLADCISKNYGLDDLKKIRGLLFRHEGKLYINEKRPLIKDLDRLPIPARHLVDYKKYIWSVPKKGLVPVTAITTQRGCPFNCIFCGVQTIFPGVRYQSVPRIIDELKSIVSDLNITHIQFQDDTMTLNKRKMEDMIQAVKDNHLEFTWEGYTRANIITEDLLKKMKDIGLNRLSFGVETGNEKILKAIKKDCDLDSYKKAYKLCYDIGIETRCSVMFGHPFETKETIKETIKFINKLKCYQAYINITTPYPGSELLELAKEGFGGIKLLTEDWKEYRRYGNSVMEMNGLTRDDLIMMQKWGYKKFYLRPKIIWYNIRRAGLKAAFINGIAFFKSVFSK